MAALKPKFEIDISPSSQSSLEAHQVLALLPLDRCYHTSKNLRLPLGVYNVSASRVCEKLEAFCRRLELYFNASNRLDKLRQERTIRKELIDYVELSLYAAAEHVDDIDSIARGFFRTAHECEKHSAYRQLQKEVKKHKRFVSAAANAVKHQQARIRLFSSEFTHAGVSGCLHGYFVEGVEGGVICPSSIFHKDQEVFSVTTLAWEIILFLVGCSRALRTFILSLVEPLAGPAKTQFEVFPSAVVAAARLPIYTFGEEHPFSRATISISSSQGDDAVMDSKIYGSILRGWSHSSEASFGQFTSEFEGDGSSKSFRFAQPKTIVLHHWG